MSSRPAAVVLPERRSPATICRLRVGLLQLRTQKHDREAEDVRPEDVVERGGSWYHRETGENVSALLIWWRCEAGHEWQATIPDRTAGLADCAECAIEELLRP